MAIFKSINFLFNITNSVPLSTLLHIASKYSSSRCRYLVFSQIRQTRSIMIPPTKDMQTTDVNYGFGQTKPISEDGFKKFMAKIEASRKAGAPSIESFKFDERRIKFVNKLSVKSPSPDRYRGVSLWMFRDQRIDDNWALIYAQKVALEHKCPLYVTFYLMSHYSVAGTRQYDFMLRGLQELEKQCRKLNLVFHLKLGYAKDIIVDYCEENKIDFVVADFCPLRDPTKWAKEAGKKLKEKKIPLYQVDAHNIVPPWIPTFKAEATASAIRPKIQKYYDQFLTEMPAIEKHPHKPERPVEPVDWNAAWAHLNIDESVKPVTWAQPGTTNAYRMLYEFISQRLERYDEDRNIPTKHALSGLSPYFHFGQLPVHRAVLCLNDKEPRLISSKGVDTFIEEAVIRKELAENFCFYQSNYDNYQGAPDWAKETIEDHRDDKREHTYTEEQFKNAKTHDKLWNAAQVQLLQEGKMHGYFRMYWAKKIYEWSPNVEEALRIAHLLNDKYSLDGRDPNGYVGNMWSIVGATDRPFSPDRPIFGRIRWMSYFACTKKFDTAQFIRIYKC